METASCLLICGNAALYLALICRLPSFDGAFPAMLLVLGLGLGMLLLAARFRYLPALRIALAPLPFLSLLLLPSGLGWISFLPVPLIMALFAVLDRFDWDNWQTGRWMRPMLFVGALLLLHFALHTPPVKEGIALCALFFLFGIVGLRLQRVGDLNGGRTLLVVGGVVLPILIGAAAGGLLWLLLARRDLLATLLYWIFSPLIWLARRFIHPVEPKESAVEELLPSPTETPESPTPPPFDPVEEGSLVLHLPDFNWTLLAHVLIALAAVALVIFVLSRWVYVKPERGGDIEYIPEKRERKRKKQRRRSSRAVNRVRDAYRSYLILLSSRGGIRLSGSETSLQVQERSAQLPGRELSEEIRQIYLRARYAGKATAEDAQRIETRVKQLREQLLSEERKRTAE